MVVALELQMFGLSEAVVLCVWFRRVKVRSSGQLQHEAVMLWIALTS